MPVGASRLVPVSLAGGKARAWWSIPATPTPSPARPARRRPNSPRRSPQRPRARRRARFPRLDRRHRRAPRRLEIRRRAGQARRQGEARRDVRGRQGHHDNRHLPKVATVGVEIAGVEVTLSGIAKGAGMIAPDMATMLSFTLTDAPIAANVLQALLSKAVQNSFNAITVDSEPRPPTRCCYFRPEPRRGTARRTSSPPTTAASRRSRRRSTCCCSISPIRS